MNDAKVITRAATLGLAVGLFAGCSTPASTQGDAAGASGSANDSGRGGVGGGGGSPDAVGAGANDAAAGGSGTGGSTGGGTPPACPASAAGNASSGTDVFVADPGDTMVASSSITYANVGATGSYLKVQSTWSAPSCVGGTCNKTPFQVSGDLVPFDDEMSMVFAGPAELYQIGVYYPGSAAWQRIAYWDRCTTQGLAFVGNKTWYQCGGFVQSYVTADGTGASPTPVQFSGHLAAGAQVNIMSDLPCTDVADQYGTANGPDCGWRLGLGLHGFKGDAAGNKIVVAKFRMPFDTTTPAYWMLPAQVLRTGQYGCNCRGTFDAVYKGGCGELDVVEILGGKLQSREGTTHLYSFQAVPGSDPQCFNRPVAETGTFIVIFDATDRQIALRRLGPVDFDFGGSIAPTTVSSWLAMPGKVSTLP
jgi:hypothetical protein